MPGFIPQELQFYVHKKLDILGWNGILATGRPRHYFLTTPSLHELRVDCVPQESQIIVIVLLLALGHDRKHRVQAINQLVLENVLE